MFSIQVERFGDVAVLHCGGRIVQDEAAFGLRDAVRRQRNARAIVLDLSDIESLEGGGLGMLLSLGKWTRDRGIVLQAYEPPARVRRSLERFRNTENIEIAGTLEVAALLGLYAGSSWAGPSKAACFTHVAA